MMKHENVQFSTVDGQPRLHGSLCIHTLQMRIVQSAVYCIFTALPLATGVDRLDRARASVGDWQSNSTLDGRPTARQAQVIVRAVNKTVRACRHSPYCSLCSANK